MLRNDEEKREAREWQIVQQKLKSLAFYLIGLRKILARLLFNCTRLGGVMGVEIVEGIKDLPGINSVWDLLQMAEDVNPPADAPNLGGNVNFDCANGWKVVIFYDCGGLDYICHFVKPNGLVIDFWDWPDEFEPDDPKYDEAYCSSDRWFLMNWRGVGDLELLKRKKV